MLESNCREKTFCCWHFYEEAHSSLQPTECSVLLRARRMVCLITIQPQPGKFKTIVAYLGHGSWPRKVKGLKYLSQRKQKTILSSWIKVNLLPKGLRCTARGDVIDHGNAWGDTSKLGSRPHRTKIEVTEKPPIGGISLVTVKRTDTTHDHS